MTDDVKNELKKNKKKVKNLMNDFSSFAMKGNIIDLAVGVVIGGAFSKIVTSLVNDLVMPALSVLTGEINLSKLSVTLVEGIEATETTEAVEPIVLTYGAFLQTIVEFLIIAFSIFIVTRYLGKIHKKLDEMKKKQKEEEKKEEEAKKDTTEDLLKEIRDLLKEEKSAKK
ncbi:MAG: large-conductance mechanosensitive channel protein MscL [Clostridia bacterium]|nr:large-conductance mechanosensitive channel protein MscL [Clostridia bacterium]